ncbi:zinc finger MYM-type protein 5 [Acomys russatus]|uniref:zinc finger MYM-type protein 5 n=1 Tax=Acomys russatus TaxID=60746 RepID=UPI0021E327FA|nr:zinc finger MYM-type protein 5 [Acomys russatus]
MAMAAHPTDVEAFGGPPSSSVSASGNSAMEDDDVVFIESVQLPVCAPAVTHEGNFVFTSSEHEDAQGNSSMIPPSRDLMSQKGNICETIVIDDEGDTEINGEEKNPINFILPRENNTKNLDFSISSLSRSKTETAVGPFNPGRIDVADAIQNGRFAAHHNPDSWISQSASFPRNQKQQGVDSLSPVASLPKQIFQPSNQQQPTKPAKITCAHCKSPLQKGQTAYQRKGSAHLFCSTTCLSSFSHKRTRRTRNVTCKKDAPMRTATLVPPVESSKSLRECASLCPHNDNQSLRRDVFTKSRCIICNKLGEVRHEISINNITHKLCSNNCFNEYRLTNGLIMNCCEQCGKYMPKNTGHNFLITGQQKRFCGQDCANVYKEIMERKAKISLLQNRKRNAIREENERKLHELSSTISEKTQEIPGKKEKFSEIVKVAGECRLDTPSREQNENLPSVTVGPDPPQEQPGDRNSEEFAMSVELSSDPGLWPQILNTKQRDILVKNDATQIRNFNFPKDSTGRKFSETYYSRILPSGEKGIRSWLLYSVSKDAVFCLYCRLFGEGKNQLRNENGCRDWQHLSHILSKHEESEVHTSNSAKYSRLRSHLEGKTSDSMEQRFYEDGKDGVLLLYT